MLKDTLYSIVSVTHLEGKVIAELQLDKGNEMFKGHFPDQPVLPGACMLQILKEVLESALNKKIRLKKADQMKFLSIVDPSVNDMLQLSASYSINEEDIVVNATMSNVNGACFKFRGTFTNL
jgi:3-hydroxyacyl-[acyl-carrier-protein] dehydratase